MRSKMCDVRCKMLLCAALFTIHCSLFTSCRQEDDRTEIVPARHWVEKTVAVVAPVGDAATKARLERTADWFLQNFREAQMHDTLAIDLKIAWYDELSADLAELSTRLSKTRKLKGKHALFFVFESATEGQSLCELHDFIFTR